MEEVCGAGRGTFLPTIPEDNSPPRCEQTIVPGVVSHRRRQSGVGGGISAVCAKGKYQNSYFWPNTVEQDNSVQYCGWASQRFGMGISVDTVEADCRGWMSAASSLGGCTVNECTALDDCVKICNNCGACRGILHNSVLGASMGDQIACIMLAAEPPGSVVSISDPVPAPDWLLPLVFYVNTRHSQCSRSPGISRVSLFSDKGCTTMVQPTGIQDASGTAISSHWSSPFVMTPSCALTGCSSDEFSFKASFSTTTSVLCAVVHSTEEFSKGWEIRVDSGLTIEQGPNYVRVGSSLLASSSYGTAVAFGSISPNLAEGTQVTLFGSFALHCNERSSHPGQCRSNDPGQWRLDVAAAFAKMLALDPHFVTIPYTSTRRLQHDRKLQTQMDFSIEIRIVVNKPHLAALAKSLESQFADMREQSSIFNSTLIGLLSPVDDKYMQADQLSEFAGAEMPPSFSELPTATTTTTTTTTVATATAAPAPAPAAEEDSTDIVLVAIFSSLGGIALLAFIWIMCRKRKAHVTHPAPAPPPGARVSASGPTAVVIGGKAELLYDGDEGMAALSPNAYDSLPEYWNARKDLNPTFEMEYHAAPADDLKFDDLMYVPHGSMHHFQDLVSKTYRDIVTQDRLCPNGKCDKTRGGCPCVQVGGDPGLPSDFQVKRVIRVEESGMFNRYIEKRDQIKKKRVEGAAACEVPDPPFFTSDWMEKNPKSELCKLDSSVNEVYLWHGTQVRVGLQIAMNDFNLTFAGSGAGTMYGKGLYFTESSTKADEYAKDEPGGHYDGIRALLLCRVCVGKFYYTQDREPTAIDKFTAGESDSTIGDRAKKVNTYREIVVYNEDQVYPEYLVIYERLHGGAKASSPRADLPFQLELPLYWKTVGKNPYQEGFRKHRVVKHEILELFQRLVDGTCSSKPKVKRVRRVEDSALWCRYINFKRNLGQSLLEEDQKIKPPNELDGNPDSGHVLTEKILAENRGDHAISVENIQPGLNEMLLWHGTTKTAAETIAEEGFMVGNARHGRRFGTGVYLAEDLQKSLSYCSSSDGTNYVLLCRATCAHIYYTEKDWDSDADKPAKAAGCSTVLANPGKKGPREYILFDESQVYPEYIVELEA